MNFNSSTGSAAIELRESELKPLMAWLDEFGALADFMPSPLILYMLSDHTIVFANHPAEKLLNKVLVAHGNLSAGAIFSRGSDLRRIEYQLLTKKFFSIRNVTIKTNNDFPLCKNVFARLLEIGGKSFVLMTFSDVKTSY